MNKKIFALLAGALAMFMILSPLVAATPGAQQSNNDKWQSFEIVFAGEYSTGKSWITPPGSLEPKTIHERYDEWTTESLFFMTLTIGGTEVYTLTSEPVSLGYYALGALDLISEKRASIRIKESIKFIVDEEVIGTLEITTADRVPEVPDFLTTTGSFIGVGTGALKGVKVIGTDSITVSGITRTGIVMNWPGLP
jgi:hypothetical protein